MPHATVPGGSVDEQDDSLIQQVLDPENQIDFSRELEPGEKAVDAVDFGDLSDDDLADDEDVQGAQISQTDYTDRLGETLGETLKATRAYGLGNELQVSVDENATLNDGFDDLFDDAPPSSGDGNHGALDLQSGSDVLNHSFGFVDDQRLHRHQEPPAKSSFITSRSSFKAPIHNFLHADTLDPPGTLLSREQQLQQELFAMSRSGAGDLDCVPELKNQKQLLASLWPKFEHDTIPRFMDLLPPKRARYMGKTFPKQLKPVSPSRISLELAQDQEKSFKVSSASNKRSFEDMERLDFVHVLQHRSEDKKSDEDIFLESFSDSEKIGGTTWEDLQIVGEDWDVRNLEESLGNDPVKNAFVRAGNGDADRNVGSHQERKTHSSISKASQTLHNIRQYILTHYSSGTRQMIRNFISCILRSYPFHRCKIPSMLRPRLQKPSS